MQYKILYAMLITHSIICKFGKFHYITYRIDRISHGNWSVETLMLSTRNSAIDDKPRDALKNVVGLTVKPPSKVTQGHCKWCHSILVFYSNFVPNTRRFCDIRLVTIQHGRRHGGE